MKSAVRNLSGEWAIESGDTSAVPGVRRGIMSALRREAEGDADLWSAEIVVAELLSNAVTHGRGPAFVRLRWDGDHPTLSVTGDGPGPAALLGAGHAQLPADLLADGGRGLFLVASLALDVIVAPGHHGGSQVDVKLDVARPA